MSDDRLTHGHYYPAIDGLRTFAVLAVVMFHSFVPGTAGGFLGVDVFYAISGFVITLTLLREYDRTANVRLGAFYLRRFWRLTPALLAMLIFAAAVELGSGATHVRTFLIDAAQAVTYTYNIGQAINDNHGVVLNHTWSLGVEEQFYLVWAPLLAIGLARVATRRRRVQATIAAIAIFAVLRAVTALTMGSIPAFFLPWCRMDQMLVGGALAMALHHARRDAGIVRLLNNPVVPLVAAGALALVVLSRPYLFSRGLAYGGFLGVTLLAAAVIGHAYVADNSRRSPVIALLSWAPVTWLGARSYGIYLYHFPIIIALAAYGVGWAPKFVIAAAGSVVVAALSYRFIEQPAQAYGRRRMGAHAARVVPEQRDTVDAEN